MNLKYLETKGRGHAAQEARGRDKFAALEINLREFSFVCRKFGDL